MYFCKIIAELSHSVMSSGAFTSRADPVETTTTTVAFSAETSDDEGAVEMERGNVEERMGLVDPKKVHMHMHILDLCA